MRGRSSDVTGLILDSPRFGHSHIQRTVGEVGRLRKPSPKPELWERAVRKRGAREVTRELRNDGLQSGGEKASKAERSMESSAARAWHAHC